MYGLLEPLMTWRTQPKKVAMCDACKELVPRSQVHEIGDHIYCEDCLNSPEVFEELCLMGKIPSAEENEN